MKKLTAALTLATLASIAGCGNNDASKQVAAPAPPKALVSAAPVAVTSGPATTERLAVNVDESIVKACNVHVTSVDTSPKFDFDSEQLNEQEKSILEQIAKCLSTGPLKGRAVDLIGRADPRGETEYNLTLGAKRARTAHAFLASLGVAGDKIFDTSRGELDATGKDEQGWRNDRRVDVRLRGN